MDLINITFNFLMEGLALSLFSFIVIFLIIESLIYIVTKFIF